MGFNSIDDMVMEMTAGKTWRQDWNKISGGTAAWAAGTWNDLSQLSGIPVAGTYPGAALVAQTPMDQGLGTNPSFGMWHGGDVLPDTKHVVNLGCYATAATAVPGIFMLVDIVMYYPGIALNSTTQQIMINGDTVVASASGAMLLTATSRDFGSTTSTITSVRFTTSGTLPTGLSLATTYYVTRVTATTSRVSTTLANAIAGTHIAFTDAGTGTHTMTVTPDRYADGSGLRVGLISTANITTSVATPVQDNTAGTGTDYINQSGVTRQFGAAVTHAAFGTNTPLQTRIVHSTTAANGYGPSLPLASGDSGIRSLTSYRLSTAYTGAAVAAAVIYRPLATLPIVISGSAGERNLLMQLPSLPRIQDHACLSNFFFGGQGLATNSALMGYADFAWG